MVKGKMGIKINPREFNVNGTRYTIRSANNKDAYERAG
ncbi:hypothetical protein J2S10_002589 [Neobacillus ginsengisoli]|uniref:Uncharacterized protein n=1 Tax=Neobacillus ginsengisoli TaxID=904295 RepID=A0ABT9XWZ5_9BACI|nr:hypothetical protein [Neobacillus ginsengisoli]